MRLPRSAVTCSICIQSACQYVIKALVRQLHGYRLADLNIIIGALFSVLFPLGDHPNPMVWYTHAFLTNALYLNQVAFISIRLFVLTYDMVVSMHFSLLPPFPVTPSFPHCIAWSIGFVSCCSVLRPWKVWAVLCRCLAREGSESGCVRLLLFQTAARAGNFGRLPCPRGQLCGWVLFGFGCSGFNQLFL